MRRFISQRVMGLEQSDIRTMTRLCVAKGGINLGQGICDLPTPPLVAQGAIDAIRNNQATYSFPEGSVELRNAIAHKLQRHNGITADPNSEVVVTVGASGAYLCSLLALLNPGDGILLFEPYYGYHLNTATIVGLEPQFVPLHPPHFSISETALLAALKHNTRALVLCTPANPSGKMLSAAELEIIDRFAAVHDLLVITDEIYEYIRYDGRPHISPATIGSLKQRTVSIMGLSKTFSITGWRLGYAVAPTHFTKAINLVNDLSAVCAPTPLQLGAAAGFAAPETFFSDLQKDYQEKRDMICDALTDSGLTPFVPEGAYYVLADARRLGHTRSRDAAITLLDKAGVASIPGSAFYRGEVGESLLRFCFAKERDVLQQACQRLRNLDI